MEGNNFIIGAADKSKLASVAGNLKEIGKSLVDEQLTIKTAKEALEIQAEIILKIIREARKLN